MPDLQTLKRILVAILGGSLLAAGLALLVLPGPAVIVIPAGLALLAIEFAWARRWLRHVQALVRPPRPVGEAQPAQSPLPSRQRHLSALKRLWHSKRRRLLHRSVRES